MYRILLTSNDTVFPIYFHHAFSEGDIWAAPWAVLAGGGEYYNDRFEEDVAMTKPEAPSVQRRKVLLAGVAPSVQGLISTFLSSMGWACSMIQSNQEMPALLEREAFDALVVDLGRSQTDAEQTILRIKQMRPSLGDRTVVLSDSSEPEIMELIERHDLIQLSQESLLPQLWATLLELLSFTRSRELSSRGMPVARMIFDSIRYPLPAGIRSSAPGPRQLAYQHKSTIIDLSIQPVDAAGRMSLTGQVLDGERKYRNDILPVILACGTGTVARTATNQSGEFHMECEIPEGASLEIRLGERSWVLVPLGKMVAAKRALTWQIEA